jgi:hypothetical protein
LNKLKRLKLERYTAVSWYKNIPAKPNLKKTINIVGRNLVNIFIEIKFTANIEVPIKAHRFQISIFFDPPRGKIPAS